MGQERDRGLNSLLSKSLDISQPQMILYPSIVIPFPAWIEFSSFLSPTADLFSSCQVR